MVRRSLRSLSVSGVAVLALFASATGASAGTTWMVMPTPNPAGQTVSDIFFTGVSGTSNADVWAVGMDQIGATRFPLIEHWNGQRWRAVRVPRPANRQSWFNAVLALSPTNAWAVGESTDPQADNSGQRTLIEHWDGTSWTIVPSPNPAVNGNSGDVLMGIDGVGPNDLWVTGWAFDEPNQAITLLFEHFDGTVWTVVPPPAGQNQFGRAITAVASNDVWAVGDTALERTLAAHWNGRRWRIVPTPSLQDGIAPLNSLTGVTANGPNDVWASGYEGNVNNQNFQKPYMLHWDGTAWTLVLTPNLGGEGSKLRATIALSANDVWAVGQTQELDGNILTFTEQFDGTTWNVVASPSPGGAAGFHVDSLSGVASPGPGAVVAVGAREISGQCCLRTLALATTHG